MIYIPVWLVSAIIGFIAGVVGMFALGVIVGNRQKRRVAKMLRETLPSGDDDVAFQDE